MRITTLFCAIAMVVAFALPAQGAVQNVKVSGDITLRGIYRGELDLDDDDAANNFENESLVMSTVGVNIEADLTDNVSATIRVINQRDVTTDDAAQTDVDIDLAYISLKEMLYSPLTLILGRQDIWIGDGFLVGARLQDPSPSISAKELTEVISFDAIRGILDYDPWTVDILYAKISEGTASVSDDVDLYGLNFGYIFEQYEAEAEGYYFCKYQGDVDDNVIHTIGVRGSMVPMENLDVRLEIALQFGEYDADSDRDAMAIDLSGTYAWVDYTWMPTLGLEYVYLSGQDADATGTDDYEAFDRMYYGKTYSAIREWQDVYYTTAEAATPADVNSSGARNAHMIILSGSGQPTDNVLVEARYLYLLLAEDDAQGEGDVGSEFDLKLTYDYTEDVSFGLLAAWFFPGDVFAEGRDDTATEIIGTVSLVF